MQESRAMDVAPQQSAVLGDMRDAPGFRSRSRSKYDGLAASVNQNGCFEFDRVIKCGYVEKRTQKTKKWKTVYIVLRPNTLSLYKNERETKLCHQVHLSDLTAVAFLKDPKHRRDNVFGLFSPSRNFHFQAPTAKDAQQWVELIRRDARIEEEEGDMFLGGRPAHSLCRPGPHANQSAGGDRDRILLSSSPEMYGLPAPGFASTHGQRESCNVDSSGMSGTDHPSHSDLSDNDGRRPRDASVESLALQSPAEAGSLQRGGGMAPPPRANRSGSQVSAFNNAPNSIEQDPDRVIWQGWLWMLRTKGGVRQWKDMWGVLRPRNFILYKDESEYTAKWIAQLSAIVDVVDIDPLSKSKPNCLHIITEEKSRRFCAHDEESLVQFIGALKSLLAKRRELEARAAGAS